MRLRLCSNSITRAKLLKKANIEFIQNKVDFDEDSIKATTPKEFVYKATLGKYKEAKKLFSLTPPILVADTVVTSQGKILRKAKDEDDARKILKFQSNTLTSIITCTILEKEDLFFLDISSTDYIFSKFDEDEMKKFLKSGEWRGKAGACMVEGFCKSYIKEVKGLESNAMGLPVEKIVGFL
jgi:septum formation protein